MKRYVDAIPWELIEAARIDGASNLRLFTAPIVRGVGASGGIGE